MKQWIPTTTSTNLDSFLQKLKNEKEFLPFGEQIDTYRLKTTNYQINRVDGNLSDHPRFIEWYSRLETFLVFYIDAASTIDKDDSNWLIYLLYEEYLNEDKDKCFAPIGFVTVYLYYAYPEKKRPRISQVLILPPYQRQGHGRRLLKTIYNELRTDPRVQDITAEDPSEEFVALRDLVSFELAQKDLSNCFSKQAMNKTDRLTKQIVDQARQICKLTKVS